MKIVIKQFADTTDKKGFKMNNALKDVAPSESEIVQADDAQIQNVFNQVYFWTGIICVVIIIASGIYYMTASGDSGKVKRAKDTLTYAVVGLVVVILAFAITTFVLGSV